MPKISINWITGKRLMDRWGINQRELYIAISELGLPVYNSDLKRENKGVIYKEIPNEKYKPGLSLSPKYFIERNNLYDFQQLLENRIYPGLHNLTEERILDSLLFKIEDIQQFEKEHRPSLNLKDHDLSGKEAQELGRL
jgi:hypothetical protein